MIRKVNLVGPSTLTVSLPTKWIKKFNIKKGDEIDLIERGSNLVLNTQKTEESKEVSIDITNMHSSYIWRVLRSFYCAGYTKITVNFTNSYVDNLSSRRNVRNQETKIPTYLLLRNITDRLTTMTLVDHSSNSAIIKETSKLNHLDIEVLIKRILKLLSMIAKETSEAMEDYNEGKLAQLFYMDDEINDYVYTCVRVLTNGILDESEASAKIILLNQLESIADLYLEIVNLCLLKKATASKETQKDVKEVNEIYFEFIFMMLNGKDCLDLNLRIKKIRGRLFEKILENKYEPYTFFLKEICHSIEEAMQPLIYLNFCKKLKNI